MLAPYVLSSPSFLPPTALGQSAGWIFAVGVLGVGFGSFIAFLFVRARALRAWQAHEHALLHDGAEKPLSRGPGRVVRGRVELDGTDDVAVEIDIRQVVKNHRSKSSMWHTWEEVSRDVRAGSFYLVRDDGQAVYVEATEAAFLVDSLATAYPDDRPSIRIRSADVRRGETFYAYGDLVEGMHARAGGAAYRDGAGWILRAPRSARMLLATEAIRDRYEGRVAYLRKTGIWLAAAFVALHAIFTLPFVAAVLFGEHTTAEVSAVHTYVTKNKGNVTIHYVLTAHTADGLVLSDQVDSKTYRLAMDAKKAGPVAVPIVKTGTWEGASFLGDEPYVYAGWIVCGVFGAGLCMILVGFAYPSRFAWYDRKKLGERGGTGYWVETRPGVPIGARD